MCVRKQIPPALLSLPPLRPSHCGDIEAEAVTQLSRKEGRGKRSNFEPPDRHHALFPPHRSRRRGGSLLFPFSLSPLCMGGGAAGVHPGGSHTAGRPFLEENAFRGQYNGEMEVSEILPLFFPYYNTFLRTFVADDASSLSLRRRRRLGSS